MDWDREEEKQEEARQRDEYLWRWQERWQYAQGNGEWKSQDKYHGREMLSSIYNMLCLRCLRHTWVKITRRLGMIITTKVFISAYHMPGTGTQWPNRRSPCPPQMWQREAEEWVSGWYDIRKAWLAIAGLEDGRGHEARSVGRLWKLEKASKGSLPWGLQKEHSPADPSILASKTHFRLLAARTGS